MQSNKARISCFVPYQGHEDIVDVLSLLCLLCFISSSNSEVDGVCNWLGGNKCCNTLIIIIFWSGMY